ncbi:MAG: hypothetical protein IPG57_24050 [Burkholderiales bacterium]|jgi:hypothetical protein|nr:hypothetical protein [Burkholderiales bacterium]MBP6251024.1 hypothetical protein [Leptothrix sp. (in: b-proteobacteria)]MBP7519069.1 hypothetical protein [Leptothrix sp. (in: b-proteobacteria)]HQY08597.1 hypothetical protein [Burkholderiaceae bacterium]
MHVVALHSLDLWPLKRLAAAAAPVHAMLHPLVRTRLLPQQSPESSPQTPPLIAADTPRHETSPPDGPNATPAEPAEPPAVPEDEPLSCPSGPSPERPALPYSAPDWEGLSGLSASGLPIRLRLSINAAGQVDALQVLQAAPDDHELVEGISRQLRQTRYAPARLNGRDVPSCSDLEIQSSAVTPG